MTAISCDRLSLGNHRANRSRLILVTVYRRGGDEVGLPFFNNKKKGINKPYNLGKESLKERKNPENQVGGGVAGAYILVELTIIIIDGGMGDLSYCTGLVLLFFVCLFSTRVDICPHSISPN